MDNFYKLVGRIMGLVFVILVLIAVAGVFKSSGATLGDVENAGNNLFNEVIQWSRKF